MNTRPLTLAVAALLAVTALASAESFNAKRIPADVAWMAHADIQGAVQSNIGKLVIEGLKARGLDRRLASLKSLLNLDPLNDFHSITLFGTGYAPQDAVAIVQMGAETGKLKDMARMAEDYQLSRYGKYEIHSWMEKHGPHPGHRKYAGVWPSDMLDQTLLVFADTKKQVTDTIDLIEGRGNPLGNGGKQALADRPGKGSMLFIAGNDLSKAAANHPHSPMMANMQDLVFDIGEANGTVYMSASVVTVSTQAATQLHQLIQGTLAMVQLSAPSAGDGPATPAAQLAQAVKVNMNGTTITADFTYPSDKLYELMQKAKQAERARRDAARQR